MFCPKCGAETTDVMNFCGSCGTALNAGKNQTGHTQERGNRRGQQLGAAGAVNKTRRFESPKSDLGGILDDFEDWLRSNNYETQRMTTEEKKVVVQARRPGEWRKLVGMATATNVVFNQSKGSLVVEVGAGQWLDKAPWVLIGAFVALPLALPAGIGAWEQWRHPDYIFEYLSDRIGA